MGGVLRNLKTLHESKCLLAFTSVIRFACIPEPEPSVRRLSVLLVLVAACRAAPMGSALTGAESPRAAVERFLAAARAQDLQALGAVWGDEKGATRERIPRPQLEELQIIQLCLLKHEQSHIADPAVALGGRLTMQVDLTQGSLTANVKFTVAKGPSNRWYVADFDAVALQNKGFCKRRT